MTAASKLPGKIKGREDRILDSGERVLAANMKPLITITSSKFTSTFKICFRLLPGSFRESSLTETKIRHFSKNIEIKLYWQKAFRTSPCPDSLKKTVLLDLTYFKLNFSRQPLSSVIFSVRSQWNCFKSNIFTFVALQIVTFYKLPKC